MLQTQVSVTLHCGMGWNGDNTIKERNIYLEDIYTYNRIRLFNAMIQFGEIELMINKFTLKNTIHKNA